MNKSCEKCAGKCCYGPKGWVEVYPQDVVPSKFTVKFEEGKTQYTAMKMVRVKGSKFLRCAVLVDGKCSIYKERPYLCRIYCVGGQPCKIRRKLPIPH